MVTLDSAAVIDGFIKGERAVKADCPVVRGGCFRVVSPWLMISPVLVN